MGGLGVLPQKIFGFFILQKHILSIFWSRIPLKLLGFIRNKVISFLFFPEQNILAISLPILFPCTFPCKCLNFLLQGNFLASGSPVHINRSNFCTMWSISSTLIGAQSLLQKRNTFTRFILQIYYRRPQPKNMIECKHSRFTVYWKFEIDWTIKSRWFFIRFLRRSI